MLKLTEKKGEGKIVVSKPIKIYIYLRYVGERLYIIVLFKNRTFPVFFSMFDIISMQLFDFSDFLK